MEVFGLLEVQLPGFHGCHIIEDNRCVRMLFSQVLLDQCERLLVGGLGFTRLTQKGLARASPNHIAGRLG